MAPCTASKIEWLRVAKACGPGFTYLCVQPEGRVWRAVALVAHDEAPTPTDARLGHDVPWASEIRGLDLPHQK
eukprot:scaffold63651_cov32-Prasinocladus_malaysianus.AAC.1